VYRCLAGTLSSHRIRGHPQSTSRSSQGGSLPVQATSTTGQKSLSSFKRRITFENKKISPAKLAGQLRYAVLVMILDIIHVLEYIWLMANMHSKKDGEQAKSDVYEKLTLIFQGQVASYILALQHALRTGTGKKSQKHTFNSEEP
jgi:hypothetical protein